MYFLILNAISALILSSNSFAQAVPKLLHMCIDRQAISIKDSQYIFTVQIGMDRVTHFISVYNRATGETSSDQTFEPTSIGAPIKYVGKNLEIKINYSTPIDNKYVAGTFYNKLNGTFEQIKCN